MWITPGTCLYLLQPNVWDDETTHFQIFGRMRVAPTHTLYLVTFGKICHNLGLVLDAQVLENTQVMYIVKTQYCKSLGVGGGGGS